MNTVFFSEPIYTKLSFFKTYNLVVSEEFLECAEKQLAAYFEKRTGLSVSGKVNTSKPWSIDELNYIPEECSFNYKIFINNNWNPIIIKWKSKSQKVYILSDNNIDCDDIVFWFDGLDPVLYHQQLYPKEAIPFKLKKLGFELKIQTLSVDMDWEIYLFNSFQNEKILKDLEDLITEWNTQTEVEDSLKKQNGLEWFDSRGVVHSWEVIENAGDKLALRLDIGSADVLIIKKIIQMLSKRYSKVIERVVIS